MTRWFDGFSSWLRAAGALAERSPRFACADCPIVMNCGLEPRENCLPRLEAIAAGKRRQLGPQDTCIFDRLR